MLRKILYSIDILNREYCSGWCFHRLFRKSPVELSFKLGNAVVGETICSLERSDLFEQNLHPSGMCGFECVFSMPLDLDSAESFTIHANNATKPLVTIPVTQVLDVFVPHRPVFFMHIPKTAGTSFNNYIGQYLGYGKMKTHIETLTLEQQQQLADDLYYMAGHLPLEKVNAVFRDRPGVDLHSMVREPLKQLHSHLAWIKGIALETDSEFFNKHHGVVKNLGTRLIDMDLSHPKNIERFVESLDGFQIDFFDNIQTRYFLDYRPDWVGQADFQAAVKNLDLFTCIGVTEKYDRYIADFCDHYDLQHRILETRHNPARVASLFDLADSRTQEALSPLIQFDQKLYAEIAGS